ncbi:hypothetical protein OA77_22060, partial [Pseudomonas coronafaciens]
NIGQALGVQPRASHTVPTGEAVLRCHQYQGVIALQRLNERGARGCCLGVGIDLPERHTNGCRLTAPHAWANWSCCCGLVIKANQTSAAATIKPIAAGTMPGASALRLAAGGALSAGAACFEALR